MYAPLLPAGDQGFSGPKLPSPLILFDLQQNEVNSGTDLALHLPNMFSLVEMGAANVGVLDLGQKSCSRSFALMPHAMSCLGKIDRSLDHTAGFCLFGCAKDMQLQDVRGKYPMWHHKSTRQRCTQKASQGGIVKVQVLTSMLIILVLPATILIISR